MSKMLLAEVSSTSTSAHLPYTSTYAHLPSDTVMSSGAYLPHLSYTSTCADLPSDTIMSSGAYLPPPARRPGDQETRRRLVLYFPLYQIKFNKMWYMSSMQVNFFGSHQGDRQS